MSAVHFMAAILLAIVAPACRIDSPWLWVFTMLYAAALAGGQTPDFQVQQGFEAEGLDGVVDAVLGVAQPVALKPQLLARGPAALQPVQMAQEMGFAAARLPLVQRIAVAVLIQKAGDLFQRVFAADLRKQLAELVHRQAGRLSRRCDRVAGLGCGLAERRHCRLHLRFAEAHLLGKARDLVDAAVVGVHEALARVGMGDYRKRQIGELSGGQRKRVFLARALAQEGQVILLDEPFTGVDVTTEEQIIGLMKDLRAEGRVMLVSTHNLGSVPDFCDRTVLVKGTVLAYGPTETTFTRDNLERAFGGVLRRFTLGGTDLHEDDDTREIRIITDDERPFVIYGQPKPGAADARDPG